MDLIIDTSSEELLVVLKNKNDIFKNQKTNSKHLENLLSQIDYVLNSADANLSQIKTFGVVVGPGSFTGVRIGVCTVKAFMQSSKANIVAIDMLEFLNYVISKQGLATNNYCILIKSTSTKFYALFCDIKTNTIIKQMITLADITNSNYQLFAYKNCLNGKDLTFADISVQIEDYIEYLEVLKTEKIYVTESQLKPVYMALCQAEEELAKKEKLKNA